MNTNAAATLDHWFLNLFPRGSRSSSTGAATTLNFVPSMATMLFGLMAGEWLRGRASRWRTLGGLVLVGLVLLGAGWVLGETVCPLVKRIWTPSWAVFSTGWTLLDAGRLLLRHRHAAGRRWSFPLVVVGMNSIAMYCMSMTMRGWLRGVFRTFPGHEIFSGIYGPIVDASMLLAVFWLVCLWMYRQKVFVRI